MISFKLVTGLFCCGFFGFWFLQKPKKHRKDPIFLASETQKSKKPKKTTTKGPSIKHILCRMPSLPAADVN
jgi:hypothetical protein